MSWLHAGTSHLYICFRTKVTYSFLLIDIGRKEAGKKKYKRGKMRLAVWAKDMQRLQAVGREGTPHYIST